jgi:hypothetical protein
MKLSAILAPMIAAKAPHKLILETVQAFEAQQSDALEQRREHERERQARKRERDKPSRDVTLPPRDRSLVRAGDARVEDLTSKTDTHNSSESKNVAPAARDELAAFKAALPELTGDRLDGFLALRKAKRAACTPHAASVFRGAAKRCGMTVIEAADKCIERNWITVNPDWLATPPARGSPQAKMHPTTMLSQGTRDEPEHRPSEAPAGGIVLDLSGSSWRRHA